MLNTCQDIVSSVQSLLLDQMLTEHIKLKLHSNGMNISTATFPLYSQHAMGIKCALAVYLVKIRHTQIKEKNLPKYDAFYNHISLVTTMS